MYVPETIIICPLGIGRSDHGDGDGRERQDTAPHGYLPVVHLAPTANGQDQRASTPRSSPAARADVELDILNLCCPIANKYIIYAQKA